MAPSASGEGVRELVFVWLLGTKAGAAKAFLIGNLGFWIEKIPLSVPGGLFLLLRRDAPELGIGDLASDLVYAASGASVDTAVVAGKVLMRNGEVPGLDGIVAKAAERAHRLGL